MPVQTTKKQNLYFPDGALVSLKASGESVYTDVGAIGSSITTTLEWTENQLETANAGKTDKQIGEMIMNGGFTLINLEPASIVRFGGGVFTQVDTAASPVATIPDQDISAGWSDNTSYEMLMYTSASDSTKLRTTTKPTLTSVTLDPDGTPEVLTENNDYVIVADGNSYSGWSIVFMSAGMATAIHCGTSTAVLSAYAMKITHTDSNNLVRQVELFSVDPNSGGFAFNFKGANEDGVEEMPLTFTAKLDTSLTDGRQLFTYTVDNGAA